MRIYRGKLNWHPHATNEDLTVIFPEGMEIGKPALAFWQGTTGDDPSIKRSNRAAGEIGGMQMTGAGLKVNFMHGQDYVVDGTLSADGEAISITISAADNSVSSPSSLRLIPAGGSTVEGLFSTSSTVYNDTDDAYYCTISDSGNPIFWKNTVLASLGAVYGIVGFVTSITGVLAPVGIAIAGAALIPAGYSFWDTQASSNDPVEDLLGPGSSITRTSSSGIGPDNDLTITQLSIVNSSQLSVKTAIKQNIGDGTKGLASIVGSLDWKTVLALELGDGTWKIETKSLAMTKGFRLGSSGGTDFKVGENLVKYPVGTMFKIPQSSGEDPQLFDSGNPLNLYQDSGYDFGFVASAGAAQTSDGNGFVDLNTDPIRQLWRLMGFIVDNGADHQNFPLGPAGGDEDVKRVIAQNMNKGFVAYLWEGPGTSVRGYKNATNIKAGGGGGVSKPRIYIPLSQSLSYQRLVQA